MAGAGTTASPGLEGFLGDDWLYGGNGNDFLYGGGDNNRMFGGLGNDSYFVLDAGDVVSEAAGGGDDTVYLDLGDFARNGDLLPRRFRRNRAHPHRDRHVRNTADRCNLHERRQRGLCGTAARSVSGLGGNDAMI